MITQTFLNNLFKMHRNDLDELGQMIKDGEVSDKELEGGAYI